MAYEVALQPGEELVTRIDFSVSEKSPPFHFAITNQAIYIPRTKLIAKSDPYYFQRVAADQVRHIDIHRLRPYGLWMCGIVMIVVGLATLYAMIEPLVEKTPGLHHVSGWPAAILVGGLLIPIAARGRFGLEIWFDGGKFRWKPPLVVDKASKDRIAETITSIAEAARKVGIQVSDGRRT